MKIGIGISTVPEREELLNETLAQFSKYAPVSAELVVYNDVDHEGVANSKNNCLELLDDCEHIFLFDDDTYPIAPDWWKPYVESKEPHLMYQFKIPGKPSSDMRELYRDDEIVAYSHTRGAMLYIHRSVLDVVGGMDTDYGQGMYEHTDWTNRIHNAGLTAHRAMDVVGSNKLIYCLDQDVGVKSSIPPEVRHRNIRANRGLYQESKTSREYKEYRT